VSGGGNATAVVGVTILVGELQAMAKKTIVIIVIARRIRLAHFSLFNG
jgi:hypothetical protein